MFYQRLAHLKDVLQQLDEAIHFVKSPDVRIIQAESFSPPLVVCRRNSMFRKLLKKPTDMNIVSEDMNYDVAECKEYIFKSMRNYLTQILEITLQYVSNNELVYIDFTSQTEDMFYLSDTNVLLSINFKKMFKSENFTDFHSHDYTMTLAKAPLYGFVLRKKN